MALPRFTLRQLFICMCWISFGCACLTFALRPKVQIPLHSSYDSLATLEPVSRVLATVIGSISIALGVIFVLTPRRRMRTLMHAMCGGMLGVVLGMVLVERPLRSAPASSLRAMVVLACAGVGACLVPALLGLNPGDPPARVAPRNPFDPDDRAPSEKT